MALAFLVRVGDGLEGVKDCFGCDIGGMGKFGGGKVTKVPHLPCDPDLRLPFPRVLMKAHAQVAGLRVTLSPALILLILLILRLRSFAQIGQPVIVANPIDVIYLVDWPFSC